MTAGTDAGGIRMTNAQATLPFPSDHPRSRDHLFVSYSHADRALVERLANDLRTRGHVVWVDFEGIRGGDEWRQSIADGIGASRQVLLMVSPDSVRSEVAEADMALSVELS